MKQPPTATNHNHPLTMDIQLIYGPLGVVSAVTRWVSEEEMGIDTGRVLLEELSQVEITFAHSEESQTVYHRIRAHVRTHHQGSATLRFLQYNRAARQALHQIMRSVP